MLRRVIIAMVLGFGFSLMPTAGKAAAPCTGVNCGTKSKQEAMPGQLPKHVTPPKKAIKKKANVVTKKPGKSRNEYTAEQRAKILENARAVCRASFGASSTVYRLDYKKWQVTCVRPGG